MGSKGSKQKISGLEPDLTTGPQPTNLSTNGEGPRVESVRKSATVNEEESEPLDMKMTDNRVIGRTKSAQSSTSNQSKQHKQSAAESNHEDDAISLNDTPLSMPKRNGVLANASNPALLQIKEEAGINPATGKVDPQIIKKKHKSKRRKKHTMRDGVQPLATLRSETSQVSPNSSKRHHHHKHSSQNVSQPLLVKELDVADILKPSDEFMSSQKQITTGTAPEEPVEEPNSGRSELASPINGPLSEESPLKKVGRRLSATVQTLKGKVLPESKPVANGDVSAPSEGKVGFTRRLSLSMAKVGEAIKTKSSQKSTSSGEPKKAGRLSAKGLQQSISNMMRRKGSTTNESPESKSRSPSRYSGTEEFLTKMEEKESPASKSHSSAGARETIEMLEASVDVANKIESRTKRGRNNRDVIPSILMSKKLDEAEIKSVLQSDTSLPTLPQSPGKKKRRKKSKHASSVSLVPPSPYTTLKTVGTVRKEKHKSKSPYDAIKEKHASAKATTRGNLQLKEVKNDVWAAPPQLAETKKMDSIRLSELDY